MTVAALGVFLALLILTRPPFPSFDEWKYFGIGDNIWAGRGPTTVFGGIFLLHGPIWPAVVALPHALFGADMVVWGRLLNAVGGMGIVALAGWFGWRIRPAAGAIAAVAMIAMVYLFDQARTARLDVPAAAFALAYIALGLEAIKRRSVRWGMVAGAVFAVGFLIKEIDMPFAPAPFLAAIVAGRPLRVVGRVGAGALLAGAIGLSWWFAFYALEYGKVYRLDAPGWTLVPLTILVVALVVLGFAGPRLAESGPIRRLTAGDRGGRIDRLGPLVVGVGGTFAWSGLMLLALSRTARLRGESLFSPAQWQDYVTTWFKPVWPFIVLAVIGVVLATVAYLRDREAPTREAIGDLLVASICGLPLVLLVIGVGEPPRNYLAQLALASALAGAGWLWAAERVLAWLPTAVPRSAARTSRLAPAVGPLVLVGALLAGSGVLGVFAILRSAPGSGPAREAAVSTAETWIREHVPHGSTIGFGSFLGYEMALGLDDDFKTVKVRHRQVVSSPTAPEGLIRAGEDPADDWLSIDIAPRNVNEFQGFRAGWLLKDLRRQDVDVWVYSIGEETAAGTVLAAATPDHGFQEIAHWSFPVSGQDRALETYVYQVNLDRLSFDSARLYIAPEALDRLIDLLGRDPAEARPAAQRLLDRVTIIPSGAGDAGLMDRLRILAGG